jgi:hypothetical protein
VTDTYHGLSAPDTEAFFFAALYEPAQDTAHPLAQACTVEEMCDEAFVLAHLRAYIAAVEVVEARSPAQATYRVRFTDAQWAKHLRGGLSWDSASYDIGEPTLRPALHALTKPPRAAAKKGAKKKARAAVAVTAAEPSASAAVAPRSEPAAAAEGAPYTVKVTSLMSTAPAIELRVKARHAPPPVTAAFFFRALWEEVQRSVDSEARAAWSALCPESALGDDARAAAAADANVARAGSSIPARSSEAPSASRSSARTRSSGAPASSRARSAAR